MLDPVLSQRTSPATSYPTAHPKPSIGQRGTPLIVNEETFIKKTNREEPVVLPVSITSLLCFSTAEYDDISVECGTTTISLSILLCPVVFTGYNESLLILNNMASDPQCKGFMDESVSPPVVRFEFPLNDTNSCGSVFKVSPWRSWSLCKPLTGQLQCLH